MPLIPSPAGPALHDTPRVHGKARSGDRIQPATRWLAAAVLLFLADAAQLLLLLPGKTGELFAWTIGSPMSAMVLGSAYVAGGYFFARVLFARSWHSVAAGFLAVMVFVWVALGATILHFDRFTHDSLAFAAWAAIYFLAPPLLPVIYLSQRATARPADTPLARGLRLFMGGAGGAVTLAGLLLLLSPRVGFWPWPLMPVCGSMVAAVIALFGSLWVAVALRGGQTAARIPLESHAVGLVFLLLAAVRAHGEIDWSNPLAMLLATGVAGMLILDAYLIATARSSAAAR
jgi:hypothetical protein